MRRHESERQRADATGAATSPNGRGAVHSCEGTKASASERTCRLAQVLRDGTGAAVDHDGEAVDVAGVRSREQEAARPVRCPRRRRRGGPSGLRPEHPCRPWPGRSRRPAPWPAWPPAAPGSSPARPPGPTRGPAPGRCPAAPGLHRGVHGQAGLALEPGLRRSTHVARRGGERGADGTRRPGGRGRGAPRR